MVWGRVFSAVGCGEVSGIGGEEFDEFLKEVICH